MGRHADSVLWNRAATRAEAVEQFDVAPAEADDLAAAHRGAERELDNVAGETPPLGVCIGSCWGRR